MSDIHYLHDLVIVSLHLTIIVAFYSIYSNMGPCLDDVHVNISAANVQESDEQRVLLRAD